MKTLPYILIIFSFLAVSCEDDFVNSTDDFDGIQHPILSSEEVASLMLMREEEKLARDTYMFLFEKWNIPIFANISKSEQQHMDAVLSLLNYYGLTDPASADIPGSFEDQVLQELFDQLTVIGTQSQLDAFKVGAAIEEIDILDLRSAIENDVKQENILLVYNNLERGSRNHLRSFVKQIEVLGELYVPQYMQKEEYDEIINSPKE